MGNPSSKSSFKNNNLSKEINFVGTTNNNTNEYAPIHMQITILQILRHEISGQGQRQRCTHQIHMELRRQQCLFNRLIQQLEEEHTHGEAGRLVLYHPPPTQANTPVYSIVIAGTSLLSMESGGSPLKTPPCPMTMAILITISTPLALSHSSREATGMTWMTYPAHSTGPPRTNRGRRVKNSNTPNTRPSCHRITSSVCT